MAELGSTTVYGDLVTKDSLSVKGNTGLGVAAHSTVPLYINKATGEQIRIADTGTSGSPFISFYQGTTYRGYIQYNDSGDNLIMASKYGTVGLYPGSGGSATLMLKANTTGVEISGTLKATSTSNTILTVNASSSTGNPEISITQNGYPRGIGYACINS